MSTRRVLFVEVISVWQCAAVGSAVVLCVCLGQTLSITITLSVPADGMYVLHQHSPTVCPPLVVPLLSQEICDMLGMPDVLDEW